MGTLEFAHLNLFEPLGIHDVVWSTDPQGTPNGHGELYLHPRDAAKLGFLWLHGGQWEGKQIISREWVRASSQMQIATGPNYGEDYGYGWWVARPGENPTFDADGRGGQKILVFPAMDLVIVTTGGGFELGDVEDYLVAAIGKTNPLPDNPAGIAELKAALDEVAQPLAVQPVPPLPDIARTISGHTYLFDENLYHLASVFLEFNEPAEARLALTYYGDMRDYKGLVGLDGRYRFSRAWDGSREFIQGLRGAWTDAQTFVLDYNEIASPNAMMLSMHFDGERVTIEGPGPERDGTISVEGWQE
jgi:hypothetical protein